MGIRPRTRPGPAVEAVVDRRVRAVFARTVAPATAGLEHMLVAIGVLSPAESVQQLK